jgi:outer membrane murein-binding lipoprotein Lpp
MSTTRLIQELRSRVEQTEADLLRARERAQAAEERAALAEKSARDGWAFAKAIMSTSDRS